MKKILILSLLAASMLPVTAQEDLGSLVNKGLTAMNNGQWEEALAANTEAVERFGNNNPLQLYGPQFGVIWYRKGLCELRFQQWENAIKSFETCYKNFPNDGDVAGGGNIFHKMALLKWGEAAMGAGDFQTAINQWKKFIEEREPRDRYPRGAFHINMAICHFNLAKIPEGIEHLEIAIKNKATFPTPDSAIISGFQALVTAAITEQNEQVLSDFIAKNRGELMVQPFEMQAFSGVFMKLAGDALNADMLKTALSLYQLIPSSDFIIADLRNRINAISVLPGILDGSTTLRKATLQENLAAVEADARGPRPLGMVKLAALAFIHENNGHARGAYAAYLQLENSYPHADSREDNLYNLVRTSSIISETPSTQQYAQLFLEEFPESSYVPAVRRLILSALFFDGKYETCIEIASEMIGRLEVGSEEHDICLHVLGGSYFYTGQYDTAQPRLDDHVETYPESVFAMSAAYFQASNLSRLQFWTRAARLLDAFIEKYKDDSNQAYMPLALYDRANAHYAEEENEQALEKLSTIIGRFTDSPVLDQAYNLKGNVEQSENNLEVAEADYLKAIEIAEIRDNPSVIGEALFYLTAMLGEKKQDDDNPRLVDAVPFADRFWAEFAMGSPYQAQVAVAQMDALAAVDRADEALERLQKVISEMARQPEAFGLEEAINSYTAFYLERHSPQELKDHYYNFPDIGNQDRAARALLRIAVIGVFEDVGRKAETEAEKRAATAMIQVLFDQLKTDFALTDLTNYILVKLGDFLRTNTAAPREALPFYDEALSRQDQSYRFPALLGRADVYGNSNQAADLERALEDFKRIYEDAQERREKEFALFRTVEVLMKKGDYSQAAEQANIYLDRDVNNFSTFSAQVGLLLARSFHERNLVNDAIQMYVKVWSAHMGNISISAPAVKSWMELSWQRNQTSNDPTVASDRQGAYDGGQRYIELTGRFRDRMNPADLALWQEVERLVQTYEANPTIKSKAQQEREKAAR